MSPRMGVSFARSDVSWARSREAFHEESKRTADRLLVCPPGFVSKTQAMAGSGSFPIGEFQRRVEIGRADEEAWYVLLNHLIQSYPSHQEVAEAGTPTTLRGPEPTVDQYDEAVHPDQINYLEQARAELERVRDAAVDEGYPIPPRDLVSRVRELLDSLFEIAPLRYSVYPAH